MQNRFYRPTPKPQSIKAMRAYLVDHLGYDRRRFANCVKLNRIDWHAFGLRNSEAPLALRAAWGFATGWDFTTEPISPALQLLTDFKTQYGFDVYQEGRNGGYLVLDGYQDFYPESADAEEIQEAFRVVYGFDTLCDALIADIARFCKTYEYRVIDPAGNIEIRRTGKNGTTHPWKSAPAYGYA